MAIVSGVRPAFAQGVEGGVRGGLTAATLSVEGLPGAASQAGAGGYGGGWIGFWKGRVGVRAELLLSSRRTTLQVPDADVEVASTSVDLPVLFVARWREGYRIRPTAFGGAEFSAITSVQQTVFGASTDIDDQIRDVDTGIVLGAGLEIGAGRRAVVIDVRYVTGLRDLSESGETTFRRRALLAGVGVRF